MKNDNQKRFDSLESILVDGVRFNKGSNNVLSPIEEVPSSHIYAKTRTKYLPILEMHESNFSDEELNNLPNPFGFQLFSYVCLFTLFGERVNVEYEGKPTNKKWNKITDSSVEG